MCKPEPSTVTVKLDEYLKLLKINTRIKERNNILESKHYKDVLTMFELTKARCAERGVIHGKFKKMSIWQFIKWKHKN